MPSWPRPGPMEFRIYLLNSQRRRIVADGSFEIIDPLRQARIFRDEIAACPSRFVLAFRESMEKESALLISKEPAQATFRYSLWPGYLDRPKSTVRDWRSAHKVTLLPCHTSGHADMQTLVRIAEGLKARFVTPIHTDVPHRFHSLLRNVVSLQDGECFCRPRVVQMSDGDRVAIFASGVAGRLAHRLEAMRCILAQLPPSALVAMASIETSSPLRPSSLPRRVQEQWNCGDLFALVGHRSWRSTTRAVVATAETRCSGALPALRSWLRREVLPSMATKSGLSDHVWRTHKVKASEKSARIDKVHRHGRPPPTRHAVMIGQVAPRKVEMGCSPFGNPIVVVAGADRCAYNQKQNLRQQSSPSPPAVCHILQQRRFAGLRAPAAKTLPIAQWLGHLGFEL
jgi:hypothetical protein